MDRPEGTRRQRTRWWRGSPRSWGERGLGPWIALLAAGVLAGCTEHEFEPPDQEARVAQAAEAYSASLFDSIAWDAASTRAFDGNVVYSTYCRNCHGTPGAGGTDYARNRDRDVPSPVQPDWRLAGSADSIRYRIFVGHASGMPNWGVAGITPREIDAVTFYLTEVLRPEVLSGR